MRYMSGHVSSWVKASFSASSMGQDQHLSVRHRGSLINPYSLCEWTSLPALHFNPWHIWFPYTRPFLHSLPLLMLLQFFPSFQTFPLTLLHPRSLFQAHHWYFNLHLRHYFWKNLSRTPSTHAVLNFPHLCSLSVYTLLLEILLYLVTAYSHGFLPSRLFHNYLYTSYSFWHSQPSIWHLVGDRLIFYELKWMPKDSLKWEGTTSKNLIIAINLRLSKLI